MFFDSDSDESFFIGYEVDVRLTQSDDDASKITTGLEVEANGTFLLIDMKRNRSSVKGNKKFLASTIGLEDQFESLNIKSDYEDFFRMTLLTGPMECHVSHPNFNKNKQDISIDQTATVDTIDNVALRFEKAVDGKDLILMTDIMESVEEGRLRNIFIVKSILVMDNDIRHYGEVNLRGFTCVLKLCDMWEDSSGKDYRDLTEEHVLNNAVNPNFIFNLKKTYVVPNPDEVISFLDDWAGYLRSREYLMKQHGGKTYPLSGVPEAFIAYESKGKRDPELIPQIDHLSVNNKTWTLEQLDDKSKPKVLIHLTADFTVAEHLRKTNAKRNNTVKKQFDSFIKNPIVVIDPAATNRYGEYVKLLEIEDSLVGSESSVQKIEPDEQIEQIKSSIHDDKEEYKETLKAHTEKQKEKRISDYKTNRLPAIISEYRENQRESIISIVKLDRKKREVNEKKRLNSAIETHRKNIEDYKKAEQTQQNKLKQKNDELNAYLAEVETNYSGSLTKKQMKDKGSLESKISNTRKAIRDLEKEIEVYKKKITEAQNALSSDNDRLNNISVDEDIDEEVETRLNNSCERESRRLILEKEQEILAEFIDENNRLMSEYSEKMDMEEQQRVDELKELYSIVRYHAFFELNVPDTMKPQIFVSDLNKKMKLGLAIQKNTVRDRIVIDRQKEALMRLRTGNVMNPFLMTALFSPSVEQGKVTEKEIDYFYQEKLNESQRAAVRQALSSNGLFLIQGPPGTGKTQVIAEITTQLVMGGKKVLIASENNKAVDNAFSRLPKIPEIRPVRLFSDKSKKKNENDYNLKSLTKNLYINIGDKLRELIKNYENIAKYEERIGSEIKELKKMRSELSEYEGRLEDVKASISEIEDEINDENERIATFESQNSELEAEIQGKSERLDAIRDFSDDQLLEQINGELDGEGIAIDELHDPEIMKKLCTISSLDLNREYDFYEEHEKLFEMNARKKSAKGNELVDLVKEIRSYEEEKDVSISDLTILDRFKTVPDYDVLNKAKGIIENVFGTMSSKMEKSIERSRSSLKDVDKIRRHIRDLRSERQSLEGNSLYSEYSNLRGEFNKKARAIFSDLTLPVYENEDEAIELLEQAKNKISRESSDDAGNTEKVKAYRKIMNYLNSEQQVEKDSDIYNPKLIGSANVFGITCSAGESFKNEYDQENNIVLQRLNIDVVILDEVSKLSFVELIRPILFGKTVVLVGDHRQLPPMYPDKLSEEEMAEYDSEIINPEKEEHYRSMIEDKSFFEELFYKTPDSYKTMLTKQYRMHRDIMNVDNVFYDGKLECGCKDQEKEHYLNVMGASGVNIVNERKHILFIDCKGMQEQSSGSDSFYNDAEIKVVKKLMELFNSNCKTDREGKPLVEQKEKTHRDNRLSIGVICTYGEQADKIKNAISNYGSFNHSRDEKQMVSSVDDFQGDERDIIILSMVRTSGYSKFLANYHRINVAVSRARRLLVIVGNRCALNRIPVLIDGHQKYIYREMARIIQKKDGLLSADTVVGGESS